MHQQSAPAPVAPPISVCVHCGADCVPLLVRDAHQNPFCCEGCRQVHHILQHTPNTETYAWLDTPDIQQQLLTFSDGHTSKATLSIPGIDCYACVPSLENLPQLVPGVLLARVNFTRRELTLTFRTPQTNLRHIALQLRDLGYPPHIRLDALTSDKQPHNNRSFYLKLGIAGFCFGNIMLMSFPEYFNIGQNTQLVLIFNWINALLALPVFFFSAADYHRSALASLRRGQINLDVPLSLGLAALFFRSLLEIALHNAAGYMDSLAGLVFFLLIGRWFRNKTYDTLSFERDYKAYFPMAVTRIDQNAETQVPVTALSPGDLILIRNGEIIPADTRLEYQSAQIDYSFVTGESEPIQHQPGDEIHAGGRQLGAAVLLRVQRTVSQSYLTQLWENHATQPQTTHFGVLARLADAWGRYFTLGTIALALAAAAYWGLTDGWRRALDVSTAVLMVACPCALALTIPVMLGHVIRIMGRHKFFVRNAETIAEMAAATTIVFDKTGTITHKSHHDPAWSPLGANTQTHPPLPDHLRHAVRALTRQSSHPASRALYRALGAGPLPEVIGFMEQVGGGISGRVAGKSLRIGSAAFVGGTHFAQARPQSGGNSTVYLADGETVLGHFTLPDTYRAGFAHVLHSLGRRYTLALLSGDADHERATLAPHFPPHSDLRFAQSPHDKAQYIAALQNSGRHVVMVGDGLNDAGALRQSHVGIAISDHANTFTPASDAILDGQQFDKLPQFFSYARASVQWLRYGFILSLCYNAIGLTFAVLGQLTPLVAAVLMPISSVSVVLFATAAAHWLGRRLGQTPAV